MKRDDEIMFALRGNRIGYGRFRERDGDSIVVHTGALSIYDPATNQVRRPLRRFKLVDEGITWAKGKDKETEQALLAAYALVGSETVSDSQK